MQQAGLVELRCKTGKAGRSRHRVEAIHGGRPARTTFLSANRHRVIHRAQTTESFERPSQHVPCGILSKKDPRRHGHDRAGLDPTRNHRLAGRRILSSCSADSLARSVLQSTISARRQSGIRWQTLTNYCRSRAVYDATPWCHDIGRAMRRHTQRSEGDDGLGTDLTLER